MFGRIKPIVVKEFRQVARDKRTLGVVLFIPAFMLVMFGYALNFDVKHISLAIYDADKSRMSRDFIGNFLHSEYFDLKVDLNSTGEIDKCMGEGKIRVAVVVPQDFSEQLLAGRETAIQVIVDGANSNAAAAAVGYIYAIAQSASTEITTEALMRIGRAGFAMPIDYRPRVWYNPELRSAKFLMPGLIGFILMITAVISTSLSVVREKERGTMEQLMVTPIKAYQLIIGKLAPFTLIGLMDIILVLLVATFWFNIPVKGSVPLLFGLCAIFLTTTLGLGLFVSTVSRTQQQAMMTAVFFVMLPMIFLSGFVFPIENMPRAIQLITYFLPLRYFLVIIRGLFLKGVGIEELWDETMVLGIFGIVILTMSVLRFQKRLG